MILCIKKILLFKFKRIWEEFQKTLKIFQPKTRSKCNIHTQTHNEHSRPKFAKRNRASRHEPEPAKKGQKQKVMDRTAAPEESVIYRVAALERLTPGALQQSTFFARNYMSFFFSGYYFPAKTANFSWPFFLETDAYQFLLLT